MATLQKFKLLATQCAIAASPTRSPSTSPVIHLRRRKTLRMLLTRTSGSGRRFSRQEDSPDRQGILSHSHSHSLPPQKSKKLLTQTHTLKDLFISSPPLEEVRQDNLDKATEKIRGGCDGEAFPSSIINRGDVSGARRFTIGSPRPLTAAYRYRLLRKAWRPVLISIPESKETA